MSETNRSKGLNLGNRLMLWLVAFAVIPIVCITSLGYVIIDVGLFTQTEKNMRSIAMLKKNDVGHFFHDIEKDISNLAMRRATLSLMKKLQKTPGKENSVPLSINKELVVLCDEFRRNVLGHHMGWETYRDVFLIDTAGLVVFSRRYGLDKPFHVFKGPLEQSHFSMASRKALASSGPVFADYDLRLENADALPAAHVVMPLRDEKGMLTGLLAVRFDLDGLNRAMSGYLDLGQTFEMYLAGPDGRLRTDSGKRTVKKALVDKMDARMPALSGNEGQLQRYRASDGLGRIFLHTPVRVMGVNYNLIAEMEEKEAFAMRDRIRILALLCASVCLVLMGGAAVLVAGRIMRPVMLTTAWAGQVATGDLSLRDIPCPDDDMGRFVQSFRRVVVFLKDTARLATDISVGDYSADIEPRSSYDELGASLKRMTESLKDASTAMEAVAAGDFHARVKVKGPNDLFAQSLNSMVERIRETHEQGRIQARQKSLQAELNEIMRGDQSVNDLGNTILSFVCMCFKAAMGAFYIRDEGADQLRLCSGFALCSHRPQPLVIKPGEGLVGQAMVEKRSIVLSPCPDHFLGASSVMDEVTLSSVIVYPFVREGNVEGVMELGTLGRFDEGDMGFLDLISDGVAIAIVSAMSRLKMRELLDKTVRQSDDLRKKQQELNLVNRDLKDQTEKLIKSERALKTKEEELIHINTFLEERSRFLEHQKNAIDEKNRELEKAQAELIEESMKLERSSRHKSEFLANMSHELRTPLNSILLISRLLSENRQKNLNPRQIEFARTVHSAGMDLLTLIDDILDLSRIEAGRLDLVPVHASVADLEHKILKNFKDICLEKGIVLQSEIEKHVPETMYIDMKRMDQVLKNLVSNAVKFTSKGYVKIVFSVPESLPENVRISGDASRAIRITVEDTGPGIPEDKKKAVFEAFCQADKTINRKYGGTGLGLSISRELIRIMGGDLVLESEEGRGSTFIAYVPDVFHVKEEGRVAGQPLKAAKDDDAGQGPPKIPSRDFLGKKILIVDDDMRNVYALIHCLENEELEILVGKNGRECVDILERTADVDLVIMDVMMPDMGGFEAMAKIRGDKRFEKLPVIAVTAKAMKGDREKCLEAGATEYISKPVDMDRLMSVMKDLLS